MVARGQPATARVRGTNTKHPVWTATSAAGSTAISLAHTVGTHTAGASRQLRAGAWCTSSPLRDTHPTSQQTGRPRQ